MNWNFLTDLRFPQLNLDAEDERILQELAHKLQDNYPYNTAEYAGQMIKPPHPLAQGAHWMTSFVNPNNHALDGGRATSALELECVAALAHMVGFDMHIGHLTSGGTSANLEALWVARSIDPKTTVLANEHAHYTHDRMSEVLGMNFKVIPSNSSGTMDLTLLEKQLEDLQRNELKATIVATLGTTGMGAVDPLDQIIPLAKTYGARVHVDAAYGGYFKIADLQETPSLAFEALSQADSIVIDPHKHGLQPYGCGAVLFNNPEIGRFYKHDSPYTYFTSSDLHLGEITLECSRAGASAAGLWATLRKFPLQQGGRMSIRLNESLRAAQGLTEMLQRRGYWTIAPALDIAIFSLPGTSATEISMKNNAFFKERADQGIHLALFRLPKKNCPWNLQWDQEEIVVIRSVLMKPEHNDPHLWEKIGPEISA